jgi:hypothetical protein
MISKQQQLNENIKMTSHNDESNDINNNSHNNLSPTMKNGDNTNNTNQDYYKKGSTEAATEDALTLAKIQHVSLYKG